MLNISRYFESYIILIYDIQKINRYSHRNLLTVLCIFLWDNNKILMDIRRKEKNTRFENFYGSTATKPHFSVASYEIYSRVNSLTFFFIPSVVIYVVEALFQRLHAKDICTSSTQHILFCMRYNMSNSKTTKTTFQIFK